MDIKGEEMKIAAAHFLFFSHFSPPRLISKPVSAEKFTMQTAQKLYLIMLRNIRGLCHP